MAGNPHQPCSQLLRTITVLWEFLVAREVRFILSIFLYFLNNPNNPNNAICLFYLTFNSLDYITAISSISVIVSFSHLTGHLLNELWHKHLCLAVNAHDKIQGHDLWIGNRFIHCHLHLIVNMNFSFNNKFNLLH